MCKLQIANSWTSQLVDWTARGIVKSRAEQIADAVASSSFVIYVLNVYILEVAKCHDLCILGGYSNNVVEFELGMLNEYRLTDYPNSNRSSNLKIKNWYLKFSKSRVQVRLS